MSVQLNEPLSSEHTCVITAQMKKQNISKTQYSPHSPLVTVYLTKVIGNLTSIMIDYFCLFMNII